MTPSLSAPLGLDSARVVHLIGGGGKTSLMFGAARELASRGERVITTTTTKILMSETRETPVVLLGSDPDGERKRLLHHLHSTNHVTVAWEDLPNDKLAGIGPEIVDQLHRDRVADRILVEADGSAGRSLKAHADHEPVISRCADLAIVLIGIDCIGAALDDRTVHRSALFARRLGRPAGSTIAAADVAAIVFHRDGYLAKVPEGARVVVLLNKVDADTMGNALECADVLYRADNNHRLDRVVVGSVKAAPTGLQVVPR